MHKLRFRQIHLDFHTSPAIPGIGEAFDAAEWQAVLKAGRVDSVTTFAKCHHGWSYHETKVGKMHPHLDFDLLRAQYDASKAIDVNVPIYISAGVDNVASYDHPEWREVGASGCYNGWATSTVQAGFHKMCFNTPYLDYLCEQIREVVHLFPECDGVFLDIIHQGQCCCKWCLAVMDKFGLDAKNESDRRHCAELALERYYEMTTDAVRGESPEMPVFHNSGHIRRGQRDILKYFSHLELESLPTGGWGYDHFPVSAKYVAKLGMDFMGMTGKFHTTWGEFGGYKHPNALRYECAAMLAYGAKCSVGDQLHPSGALDESTYRLIGQAYSEVEAKEPWCDDVESVADVALLSAEALDGQVKNNDADTGAARVLLEEHFLFDVIDAQMDLSGYRAVVVPDDVEMTPGLRTRLQSYVDDGGKLLLSGRGIRAAGSDEPAFDVGVELEGQSPYQPDYVLPVESLRAEWVHAPMVMYLPSQRIRVTDGESLGDVYDPYFNRTFRHFCSHQHAPPRPVPSGYACGVRKGGVLYLAHPVFTIYRALGAVACRQYVAQALDALLGEDRSLSVNLPSTGRVSLMRQSDKGRYVLHLLHADTINRGGRVELSDHGYVRDGQPVEVIEELSPVRDTAVRLKVPETVQRVTVEPQGREIAFQQSDGCVELKIDEFTCHAMVVLHYGG